MYQEAFQRMKRAAGAFEIEEIVQRYDMWKSSCINYMHLLLYFLCDNFKVLLSFWIVHLNSRKFTNFQCHVFYPWKVSVYFCIVYPSKLVNQIIMLSPSFASAWPMTTLRPLCKTSDTIYLSIYLFIPYINQLWLTKYRLYYQFNGKQASELVPSA